MPRNKPQKKLTARQEESRKFQEISEDIVHGLLEIAIDGYMILSVQQETETPEGPIFTHVANICFKKDDGGYYFVNTSGDMNFVGGNAFSNLLATKLASKGRKRSKLSVIYFDHDPEEEQLTIPADRLAFQWSIADGTITPDTDEIPLWESIPTVPGFPFENGEFDASEHLQDINGDFSFFEAAGEFLEEIVDNAPNGHHVISITYPAGGEYRVLRNTFKKEDGIPIVDPESFQYAVYELCSLMEMRIPLGLTLRSFTERTADDEFKMDSSPQEVRGWSIIGENIEQFSADNLIVACCTDAYTGKLLPPEPHVRYCDMWELEAG